MRMLPMILLIPALAALPLDCAYAASDLEGNWSGTGYVMPKSGAREGVRCRVRYDKQSEKVFRVTATCASTATKIVQTGEVIAVSGGRYAGDFYNAEYDISGRVRVQVTGNHQTVTFSGTRGQGSLSLSKR
ncbi:MAG: hypothetical protein ABL894_07740 [Hyphomicrobium sp.]